jgi:hypothetical protein
LISKIKVASVNTWLSAAHSSSSKVWAVAEAVEEGHGDWTRTAEPQTM